MIGSQEAFSLQALGELLSIEAIEPVLRTMFFFDTHAHLSDEQLWPQREAIWQRMEQAKVAHVMLIATHAQDLERARQMKKERGSAVLLSAATGPNEVAQEAELFWPDLYASASDLQAIGETGLDYHWQSSPVEIQKAWFIRYMELALATGLPLIIHCRKAFSDTIELLKSHYLGRPGAREGIFHCFAEGWGEAQELVRCGFVVSFSGIVTYKSAHLLQEVARQIPPEHYVIETDSPYLIPSAARSKPNEPAHLVLVAQQIAKLRGQTLEEVAGDSTRNARRIFGLGG